MPQKSKNKHHWVGLTPDPEKYFGFTYRIDQKSNGRFYIGKRQYWVSSGKVKKGTLRPSKVEGVWKEHHWKPSKWENYTSSSQELNKLIKKSPEDFTYTIIGQYVCKADLVYAECKAQMDAECMVKRDKSGQLVSYNKQVASVKFFPPWVGWEELSNERD